MRVRSAQLPQLALAALVFIFILFSAVGTPIAPAQTSREWKVPRDCPTIQECIKKARAGDIIAIAPGTYRENLKIAKRGLQLQGPHPKEVLLQALDPMQPVIFLTRDAKETLLKGLALSGGRHGIQMDRALGVVLSNLVISDSRGDGLHLYDVYQVEVRDSELMHHPDNGVFISSRSSRIRFENVRFADNGRDGIEVSHSQVELRRTNARDNRRCGIRVDTASVLTGAENAAVRNGSGDLCMPAGANVSPDFWDQAPPGPPLRVHFSPAGWTNHAITIDWDNPDDPSGIAAVWYKAGAEPRSLDDPSPKNP
jgi:nitrous oxidase accessory protein NosD